MNLTWSISDVDALGLAASVAIGEVASVGPGSDDCIITDRLSIGGDL